MNSTMMRVTWVAAAAFVLAVAASQPTQAEQRGQAAVVSAQIGAVAKHLQLRPQTALDLTDVSGLYCFDTGFGRGGRMTCYATDPADTRQDVLDFVNADPLIEAGLNVKDLPRLADEEGAMRPGQWYFVPAGVVEPHHRKRFPFPIILRAVNLPTEADRWIVG